MHDRKCSYCIYLVGVALVGLMGKMGYGGPSLSPNAAKQVVEQFIARIERIETIDVRFSLRVENFHEAADLDPATRPDYTLSDGRYIYDVLNDRHYLECRDSRKPEGSFVKTAMKQGITRELSKKVIRRAEGVDEKERAVELQAGLVYDDRPTAFNLEGPDYFLRISHFQRISRGLLDGRYSVQRADDESGDVRLVVRSGGGPLGDLEKGYYAVYTLSAARGFAPYRLQAFLNGRPLVEAEFNLHEVEPGLWITTGGVATTMTAFREDPVAFMQRTFEADPDSIVINGQIAPGQFDLPFPPGTSVMDSINESFYAEGLKSGQGLTKRVTTFRKHAEIMAPKNKDLDKENGSESITGTVVASYRVSWYQSVSFWLVTGSVVLVVVGIFLVRRAG